MPFKTLGLAAGETARKGCTADKERLGAQINWSWDFEISVVPSAITHLVHETNKADYYLTLFVKLLILRSLTSDPCVTFTILTLLQ